MSTLDRAIGIAAAAHAGQKDRAGAPYILHPLRMMLAMDSPLERIVAVLHDVVEDSEAWTLDGLRQAGFSEEVVTAVEHLTRREGEDYQAFVERAGRNRVARKVKMADLEDNMDVRRLDRMADRAVERLKRYHRAWWTLANWEATGADPAGRRHPAR